MGSADWGLAGCYRVITEGGEGLKKGRKSKRKGEKNLEKGSKVREMQNKIGRKGEYGL